MGKWIYIEEDEEEELFRETLEEIDYLESHPDEELDYEDYDIDNEDDWVLGRIPKPEKRVWFPACKKCGQGPTFLTPDEFMDAMGCLECECGTILWPMEEQPLTSLLPPYEKE